MTPELDPWPPYTHVQTCTHTHTHTLVLAYSPTHINKKKILESVTNYSAAWPPNFPFFFISRQDQEAWHGHFEGRLHV